ncbi:hypothetical protein K8I61_05090, partial [bacterium]|nr:hypothetical protein [bacterium]
MTTDRLFLFSALFALLLSLGCAASDDDDHPPPSANDDDATSDDDDDADNDTDDDAPTIEVLGDFPRPDFVREDHLSLEGAWDFAFDPENVGLDEAWFANPDFAQTIVVPYCVESEASGVAENDPPAVMWYARSFAYEKSAEERALMHFGAVDYHAMMWLNGEYIGEHFGGYTPFSFDVTDLLEDDNVLVVRVEDRNDGTRPRGKQALFGEPYAIWYETVSGIWQPVWIERAGRAYVERYRVEPDFATGDVAVRVRLAGDAAAATVRVEAIAPDGARASAERLAAGG